MADDLSYWAAKPTEEIGRAAWERIDGWFSHVRWSGMLGLWQASHRAAYAGWHTGGEVYKAGKDGRFRKIEANEFRNLLMHHLNMVTGQRLHFDAQADTTDYAAQEQTLVANGLAETCVREKGLERVRLDPAGDRALCREGWGLGEWDFEAGDIHVPPPLDENGQPAGKPLYTGDVMFGTAHPLDVARDFQRGVPDRDRWFIVRRDENVYDLADAHPDKADELLRLPRGADAENDGTRPRIVQFRNRTGTVQGDTIPVWYLYHDRCPALRDGRWVVLASETLVLKDEALPYRELPVHRSASMNLKGTVFGYSLFWDLLPLVQALNGSLSSLITRMSALGVPNIWMPDGAPLTKTKIGEGLNILEGGSTAPQLVDLGQLPADAFKMVETIRNLFATYSGINDVARGFATDGVKAASALALLEARALQFVALDQKADVTFMEKITSGGLHNYQDLGVASYLVKLTGKGNRYSVREFVGSADAVVDPGKKVTPVDKVTGYSIRIGNPLQETNAGRMQMADSLAQAGMLQKPEDYIQVMTTGRLEPALEAVQREELAIVAENEMLARGEVPILSAFDNHPLHMVEHKSVCEPPEARKDAAIVQAVTEHLQAHADAWKNTDPILLQGLKIAPPMMPMAGPPGPGGAPGGPPQPPGMPPPAPPEEPGPAAEAAGVGLPPQPNNPMTGQPNAMGAM